MDSAKVAGCFKDRTILITGSTGFLGKLLVEKILRVQPGVKKLYLLVRATDDAAAEQRVLHEIIGKEVFSVLREKHGADFQSFVKEKISPLAGDMRHENLGLESTRAKQLFEEIDIVVNGAAITNFYERYDVALASNTLGTVHVCNFAKQCSYLKLLLHVSTAYVAGKQKGRILEKPLQMGQTLKKGRCVDIEAELELVNEIKAKPVKSCTGTDASHQQLEKVAMKELGLKRAKYFGWPNVYAFTKAMGEMVLGMMRGNLPVVIVRPSIVISTFQDPFPGWIEGIRTMDVMIAASHEQKLPCFIGGPILDSVLYLANCLLLCGRFTEYHKKLNRSLNYLMFMAKLYTPYVFFKGCFDDTNLRKLWGTTGARRGDGYVFNFDPNCINWRLYLFNTHIPAVLKEAAHMKKQGSA